jgi:hypothetical protein
MAKEPLVPVADVATRLELWHSVWESIIRECERLASEDEAEASEPTPLARHRSATRH